MNSLGIAALLLSLSMPCAPSYNIAEPAAAIQEYIPAAAAENESSVNDQTDVVLSEETTVESEGDEGETESPDIQYLLFLQDFRNSINDAWTPFWSLFRLSRQDI